MALDAKMAFARLTVMHLLVEVVCFAVIDLGAVALGAELVLLLMAFEAVDIMTVATAHAVLVHLALHERPVDVDLFEDLAVRVIEPLGEQLRHHQVEQLAFDMPVVAKLEAPGVAGRTKPDLFTGLKLAAAHDQREVLRGRSRQGRLVGPFEMFRAGTVAGFAADVDLEPVCLVGT